MTVKKKELKTKELAFTKEQIVNSRKFRRFQDLLKGNLNDETLYRISGVEAMIEEIMKGEVK